ncbi:glycosyltransferase family 2 protein [Roseomonas xinghualingensis]|uniref:glycosyltransferase family 2 protein n=1 Tax=Roseomonas xinghualingensis TaxID=2986475 RepID=UPI0021F118F4|nr:glycosyltransferase [Roseomonas sp. SXEYE001]MCV4209820.1 glycosyltransferase [Roseomonas sp. SXEYE001]
MFGLFRKDRQPSPGTGRVSVVIPLYNHAAYITAAVKSVLAQGAVLREVIVIDDGSSDDSDTVMRRIAASDARIHFRSRSNQGAHATINEAVRETTGEFVAILNSDDLYMPGRLDALVRRLDTDAGADLAASSIAFIDSNDKTISNEWYAEAMAFRVGRDMGAALVNANFLMTTSNYLFRRNLTARIGEFAALRYTHDLDFALRATALGHGITLVEEPLLRYRLHASNTISEDHRKVRVEWAATAAAYLTLLWDRPGAPEPDWKATGAITEVLRRHELTRMVEPCMAYLRRHGGGRLDTSPLLGDETFRTLLLDWA